MKAYKAKWIITAALDGQQIFEDCALIVDEGKIFDIISQNDLNEDDYKRVEDFGNSIITPGFVNLGVKLQYTDIFRVKNHSISSRIKNFGQILHKFFSMLGCPVTSYPMLLAKIQKEYFCWNDENRKNSLETGLKLSMLAGTTCVAQISKEDMFFDVLNNSLMKTYLFFETFSDSNNMSKKEFRNLKSKIEKLLKSKSDNTFLGISPNSVPTVHKRLWRVLAKYARRNNLLILTELCESKDEADWFQYGFSDLDLYNRYLGYKKLSPPKKEISPVECLRDWKVLSKNLIVKNPNFLNEKELEQLAENDVQIAFAPRFDEHLFKTKHNFSTLLKYFPKKVGFCTDSFVNNFDLSVLNEMASEEVLLPIEELIKYITIYPAKILRLEHITGSIEKGKHADFNVFKLKKKETVTDLKSNSTPSDVFIQGKRVVKNYEITK